jgi:O-antigen ligase
MLGSAGRPPGTPSRWGRDRRLPYIAGILAFCCVCAVLLNSLPLWVSAGLVLGVAVFITCFVSVEFSLYLLVCSMLLSPEFGVGGLGGGSATTASRGITIRTEDILLLVMGFAWLARMAVHKELGLVRDTPLNKPIALYTVACFFATGMGLIWGHVAGVTGFFYVLKYIEYFVVYFMVANNVHSRDQIKRLVGVMLLTALIVSLTAIAQIPSGERVYAPFEGENGEPNTLGGYLLLVGAVAGGMLLQCRRGRNFYLLLGLIGCMFVPFLATLSRGSYLALPFVYLALMVLYPRRRSAMLLVLLAGLVLGGTLMPQNVRDRISYTFNQRNTQQERIDVGGVRLDTSTSERVRSWENAFTDALYSPLWGYGVTGYGFLDAQYPRVLVETGLLGLGLFLALIRAVWLQGMALRSLTRDPLYGGLAAGLIAGLVGLLVHGLGANTFIIVRVMEPFWLLVGLVVSAIKIEESKAP